MNAHFYISRRLDAPLRASKCLIGVVFLMACARPGLAQGTVTFGTRLSPYSATEYQELGVRFQVVIPAGSTGYDDMVILPPNWAQNVPQNATAFMGWFRQFNPYNYVALTLTNGSLFGLSSVQLADPNAPSASMLPIMFVGHRTDASSVTNTFTTPGGGATTFLNYNFTPTFASGLTSVDILATRWAMDNLVFAVPEPDFGALFVLGLLGVWAFRWRARRWIR